MASANADDAVDFAVDAFAVAGSSVGITLNGDEKVIVKAIVRCVANGVNGRAVGLDTCARAAIVQKLPAQAQPLADCMLRGKTIEACAVESVVSQLPVEARGITNCLTKRPDFGRCSKLAASGTPYREALDIVDKLKADDRIDLTNESKSSIRNIIQVAEAIRRDDWVQVYYLAGVEVYKVAAKLVLHFFLTPALAPVVDPVADAIIQHRADFFARMIKAVKNADVGAANGAIVEFYLVMQWEGVCSLPMPAEMREAMCGTVGKIIKGLASAATDVGDLAEQVIAKPLNFPSTLWDATLRGREILRGKSDDCDRPAIYYAETYARSYHRGVKLQLTNPSGLDSFIASANWYCRDYYNACFDSSRFNGLCNPQQEMYRKHVGQITTGLDVAAKRYVHTFAGSITDSIADAGEKACRGPTAKEFIAKEIDHFKLACAKDLKFQLPVKGNPLCDDCRSKVSTRDTAHWLACERALDAVQPVQVAAGACRATWPKIVRLGKRKTPSPDRFEASLDTELGLAVKLRPRADPSIKTNPDIHMPPPSVEPSVTNNRDVRILLLPKVNPNVKRPIGATRPVDQRVPPPPSDPTK